jgi:hypothetical protein
LRLAVIADHGPCAEHDAQPLPTSTIYRIPASSNVKALLPEDDI